MKRIIETLKSKWAEYLLEIIVLIIGILGAFSLDNWNDSLKEDKIRKELVNSLLKEFESNLIQLDSVIYYDELIFEAGVKIFTYMKEGEIQKEKLDTVLYNLTEHWTFNPINGALRSAISSGTIHNLKNAKLINLLYSYEDIVSDALEDEINLSNAKESMKKVLMKHYMWANVERLGINEIPSSNFENNIPGLLTDRTFENETVNRMMYAKITIQELEKARKVNSTIIDILKSLKNV